MLILHDILTKLKNEFANSRKAEERRTWFVYTLIAIIIPFTSSKTSNLLRCLNSLFGFNGIQKKRYYTFMASPKIPWQRLWQCLWKMIPEPLTQGRLLVAIDDYINPKTGKKIFGCAKVFDHAAKQNQSKYPWAQNIVAVRLLKMIKGRWACLPLAHRFYHLKKNVESQTISKPGIKFETKLEQAVNMITEISAMFRQAPIIAITDSWFGNNGLYAPLRKELGQRFHMISRLRSNNNLFAMLDPCGQKGRRGRPKKYEPKLGDTSSQTMATSLAWIYASRLEKTPERRHVVKGRSHFAFSDVRRLIAKAALTDNFSILCPAPRKTVLNSLVTTLLRMAA